MPTKTWEQHAETFDKVYALRREYFLGPALKSFLGDVQGKSVVDLGCGAGHFTEMCLKSGATAIGIDASSNMVNMAAKNYPMDITFQIRTRGGIMRA